jgi:molybdopterin-binding protein
VYNRFKKGKEIKEMKLSARNMLKGRVVKVVRGAVNAEVTLLLSGGEQVVSIITNASVESLGLKEGMEAYAVIKASSVILAVD